MSKKPSKAPKVDNRKAMKQARTEANKRKRMAKHQQMVEQDKLMKVERGTARAIRRWNQSITKQENPCQIKGLKFDPMKRGKRPQRERRGAEVVLMDGIEMSVMQAAIHAARRAAERLAEKKAQVQS